MKLISVECYLEGCNNTKSVEPFRLKKTKRFFCCRAHQFEWQRTNEYKELHQRPDLYTDVICSNCGNSVHRLKSSINKEYNFCDNSCRNAFMSSHNAIYNPNPKKEDIIISCMWCNDERAVNESAYLKNKYGHFCSKDCYWKWKSENLSGEDNPLYAKKTIPCYICSKLIKRNDNVIKRNKQSFCSNKCYARYRSEHYSGDNHPLKGVEVSQERREESRRRMLSWYKSGFFNKMSKPQIKVNDLLEKLCISYTSEKSFWHYSLDHYLDYSGLIIETMGDYFHAHPEKYKRSELHNIQIKDIERDKRKQAYFREEHDTNILYLWEDDIQKRYELCEELILLYVENHGVLPDYHSYNYTFENEVLTLNDNLRRPLWDDLNE